MISLKSFYLFISINTVVFSVSYIQYILLWYVNFNIFLTYLSVLLKTCIIMYTLNTTLKTRPYILTTRKNESVEPFHTSLFLVTYAIETVSFLLANLLTHGQISYVDDIVYFIPMSFAWEIVFDFFHYGTHRFLHSVPLLYKYIHKKHHETVYINIYSTFHHNPLDLLITNLLPILCATYIVPLSPFMLTAIFWYKTIVELSGHSGKESSGSFIQCIYLPAFLSISLFSRDHLIHHIRPNVNFSKRFALWDIVFGTNQV